VLKGADEVTLTLLSCNTVAGKAAVFIKLWRALKKR